MRIVLFEKKKEEEKSFCGKYLAFLFLYLYGKPEANVGTEDKVKVMGILL